MFFHPSFSKIPFFVWVVLALAGSWHVIKLLFDAYANEIIFLFRLRRLESKGFGLSDISTKLAREYKIEKMPGSNQKMLEMLDGLEKRGIIETENRNGFKVKTTNYGKKYLGECFLKLLLAMASIFGAIIALANLIAVLS
jgi:hypothetical protein